MKKTILSIFIFCLLGALRAQNNQYQLALLKYNGGGDWYANLETSLPNLIKFCNNKLGSNINEEQAIVEVGSPDIFNYPFIHMTGHGNVIFSDMDAENLRNYLLAGGFLHIDDNYGMDQFIRKEIKKVFPELELIEIPYSHPIYHQTFEFKTGLPKIHEHDGKKPLGLGLIFENRLICFYSVESDLGDGWESPEIHNDSESSRLKALQMGANILQFSLMNQGVVAQ